VVEWMSWMNQNKALSQIMQGIGEILLGLFQIGKGMNDILVGGFQMLIGAFLTGIGILVEYFTGSSALKEMGMSVIETGSARIQEGINSISEGIINVIGGFARIVVASTATADDLNILSQMNTTDIVTAMTNMLDPAQSATKALSGMDTALGHVAQDLGLGAIESGLSTSFDILTSENGAIATGGARILGAFTNIETELSHANIVQRLIDAAVSGVITEVSNILRNIPQGYGTGGDYYII
jgi:hypothetical protein